MSLTTTRGRPPVSSPDILQDAAFDLFIEKSYAKTSISDITQRAGVSRATFFNYFAAKSDVFWVELDQALGSLHDELARHSETTIAHSPAHALTLIGSALETFAAQMGAQRVPFALTQYELIGSVHELQASALSRFSEQARLITDFLERFGHSPGRARAAAYALVGAAISGAQEWALAGPARESLEVYVNNAVTPVIEGFVRVSAATGEN